MPQALCTKVTKEEYATFERLADGETLRGWVSDMLLKDRARARLSGRRRCAPRVPDDRAQPPVQDREPPAGHRGAHAADTGPTATGSDAPTSGSRRPPTPQMSKPWGRREAAPGSAMSSAARLQIGFGFCRLPDGQRWVCAVCAHSWTIGANAAMNPDLRIMIDRVILLRQVSAQQRQGCLEDVETPPAAANAVDAGVPVDAQNAPTRDLENCKEHSFPQASTAIIFSSSEEKNEERTTRKSTVHLIGSGLRGGSSAGRPPRRAAGALTPSERLILLAC
jgi:hypothetical protein